MQGFDDKNHIIYEFLGEKTCYSHQCAIVTSRWDGAAVSVPSTLRKYLFTTFFAYMQIKCEKSPFEGRFFDFV